MKKYDNYILKEPFSKKITDDLCEKTKIYSQKELDVFLLKLKNYYNEVNGITLSNQKKLEFLTIEERRVQSLIDDDPSEMEIQGKLMGEEIVDYTQTYDKISKKNEVLLRKKNEINQLNLVELEYKKSLEFKIESEKENLNKLFANIDDIKEKLKSIVLAEKRMNSTCEPEVFQSIKLNKLKSGLVDETYRIKQLIITQEEKINKLNEHLEIETNLLNVNKEKVKERNIVLSNEIKERKEQIIKCYEETEILKKKKVNKENHYINITLGLNLIKNYLINNSKANNDLISVLNTFSESNDYKIFKGSKDHCTSERSSTAKSRSKLPLSYLKQTITITDLEYNEIYEFHTKILNKKNFNQGIITKFNIEQIKLESQKELNNRKIQNMICRNYKNVDLIIRSNTKLENLFKKYHNYSSKTVVIPSKFYSFPELINENKEFSTKCLYFLKEIKLFLEFIYNIAEIIDKEKALDEENMKKIKGILNKISKYFNYSERVNNNEEEYINCLFNFFEKHSKINSSDLNTNVIIPNMDSTKIKDVVSLKDFYKTQMNYFFSINHEMDIKTFHTINSMDERIIDIINLINELIDDTLYNEKKSVNTYQTLTTEDEYLMTNYTSTNTLKIPKINSKNRVRLNESERNADNSSDMEVHKEHLINKKLSKKKKLLNLNTRESLKRLYNPYFETRKFHIKLNENSTSYRHISMKAHKQLYAIDKKQEETNKITDQLFIYNNPKINVENLSKTTYNSFVRQIITNQIEKNKPDTKLTLNMLKIQYKTKK